MYTQVLLPASLLERVIPEGGIKTVLLFQICRTGRPKPVQYVGVKEFSAPDQCIVCPRWIMDALQIQDGDAVDIVNADIPKGTYVKLQPVTPDFHDVPNHKAVLESAILFHYTCLSRGDPIRFYYDGKVFKLFVEEYNPPDAPAICVIDTDLLVDVSPPVISAGSARAKQTNQEHTPLFLLQPLRANIERSDRYHYYRLLLKASDMHMNDKKSDDDDDDDDDISDKDSDIISDDEMDNDLVLSLQVHNGDCEMFADNVTIRPQLQKHTYGTPLHAHTTEPNTLRIPMNVHNRFFISVMAYNGPVDYSINASIQPHQNHPNERLIGEHGKNLLQHIYSPEKSNQNDDDDEYICDHCMKPIPPHVYDMHIIQCARHNYKCTECGAVVPVKERMHHWHCPDCGILTQEYIHAHCVHCPRILHPEQVEKHIALVHTPLVCECGQERHLEALLQHRKTECMYTEVQCIYCQVFQQRNIYEKHILSCGARTYQCDICNTLVKLSERESHVCTPVTPPVTPPTSSTLYPEREMRSRGTRRAIQAVEEFEAQQRRENERHLLQLRKDREDMLLQERQERHAFTWIQDQDMDEEEEYEQQMRAIALSRGNDEDASGGIHYDLQHGIDEMRIAQEQQSFICPVCGRQCYSADNLHHHVHVEHPY